MDLISFNNWTKEEFGFDCFENDFFEKSLLSVVEDFKNSKINGVSFLVYYKDTLFENLLCDYLHLLKRLITHLQLDSLKFQLNIVEIDLNSYYSQREYLQQQIDLLECRCEDEF